jgi:ribosomal protein L44E
LDTGGIKENAAQSLRNMNDLVSKKHTFAIISQQKKEKRKKKKEIKRKRKRKGKNGGKRKRLMVSGLY